MQNIKEKIQKGKKHILVDVEGMKELLKLEQEKSIKIIIKNPNIEVKDLEVLLSKSEVVIVDDFNGEKVYNIKLSLYVIDESTIEIESILLDNAHNKVYNYVYSDIYKKIRENIESIEHDDLVEKAILYL